MMALLNRLSEDARENKVRDAGDYLVAEAEPYYVAVVAMNAVSEKIQLINKDTPLIGADPSLLAGYQEVFNQQKKIVDALQRLRKQEERAEAIEAGELDDDEIGETQKRA